MNVSLPSSLEINSLSSGIAKLPVQLTAKLISHFERTIILSNSLLSVELCNFLLRELYSKDLFE